MEILERYNINAINNLNWLMIFMFQQQILKIY